MKIGIYIDFGNKENLDLSSLRDGNPGIGGTEYQMVSLPFFFAYYNRSNYTFNVYFKGKENLIFDCSLNVLKVLSIRQAVKCAIKDRCDLFIYNGGELEITEIISEETSRSTTPLRCIAWVHVFLPDSYKQKLYESDFVKHVVCLSQEHFLQLADHPLLKKLSFIYYGFDPESVFSLEEEHNSLVCFLGNLVPFKGFHLLAEIWKDVLKEIPSAKLIVIGSANLYDDQKKLGRWGVAEEEYESILRKYLSDKNDEKLESVEFCGLLGKEKKDIMRKASVGVVNPSGDTETFCLSAIEFQALCIPVVSRNFGGLKETIKHRKTGLLSYNKRQLKRHLICLLKNPAKRKSLGLNGRYRVQTLFSYPKILSEWEALFDHILYNNDTDNVSSVKIFFSQTKNKLNRILYKVKQLLYF